MKSSKFLKHKDGQTNPTNLLNEIDSDNQTDELREAALESARESAEKKGLDHELTKGGIKITKRK